VPVAAAGEAGRVEAHCSTGIPCPAHSPESCPYPELAAGTVGVIVALAPGIVTWEEVQAAEVQRVVAVPLDRDDPGRIASHSMVVVVVLLNPAGAGVVVALRFPMFHSICLAPARGVTTFI
jgi:hypothetical protein